MPLSVETPAPPKKTMLLLSWMIFSSAGTITKNAPFQQIWLHVQYNTNPAERKRFFWFSGSAAVLGKQGAEGRKEVVREHPGFAVHSGSAVSTAWGCDLTYDYVKINGDYRT